MASQRPTYAVYVSRFAVEIRETGDPPFGSAQLVCSQHNYSDTLQFAQTLALTKEMPLQNYGQFETCYEY